MSEDYNTNRELKVTKTGALKGQHFDMAMLSIILVVGFVLISLGIDDANELYTKAKSAVTSNMSWLFVYGTLFLIAFSIILAILPFGRIRLGKDDEKPEFSTWSWFAMLFSAGMGIGLIYWSVAEPLYHTTGNVFMPSDVDHGWDAWWNSSADAKTAAARQAQEVTFFHWGIHAWAVYVVIGMALAYFSFRRGLPLTVRSALYPIIGNNIYGWFGHLIDLVAVFGTIFGVSTSLGLGVAQLNAGLNFITDGNIGIGTNVQLFLILIITAIATLSAISGIGKGVKILSELNMWLSFAILLIFLFFSGFFGELIMGYFKNLFNYATSFLAMSVKSSATEQAGGYAWLPAWTIFYWAWWIAWSPFVGMFIARISRGRTIREFVIGVLLVPTLLGALWLTVFGDTALLNEIKGYTDFSFDAAGKTYESVRDVAINASSSATYALIEALTWANVIKVIASVLVTVLIATYFITSADSGTLVVTTMLSAGSENPPVYARAFWGISIGAVAATLLYVGGDQALNALQAASITIGLPFLIVLILMCLGLFSALMGEARDNTIPK